MATKFTKALVDEMVEDEDVVNAILDIIAANDMAQKEDLVEAFKQIVERWDNGYYE